MDMLVGVADGLPVAQAADILHREGENSLVAKSGYVKLADFVSRSWTGPPRASKVQLGHDSSRLSHTLAHQIEEEPDPIETRLADRSA